MTTLTYPMIKLPVATAVLGVISPAFVTKTYPVSLLPGLIASAPPPFIWRGVKSG